MTMNTGELEIEAVEGARLKALNDQDLEALGRLMSEDLVHIHATGLSENKAAFLAGVARQPRQSKRQSTLVRIYGDAAVLTGEITNTMRRPNATSDETYNMAVTQVLRKEQSGWKFISFHATRLTKPSE